MDTFYFIFPPETMHMHHQTIKLTCMLFFFFLLQASPRNSFQTAVTIKSRKLRVCNQILVPTRQKNWAALVQWKFSKSICDIFVLKVTKLRVWTHCCVYVALYNKVESKLWVCVYEVLSFNHEACFIHINIHSIYLTCHTVHIILFIQHCPLCI